MLEVAGLNLMKFHLAEKYNLGDFEFSQNYFMFDKLEKSNYFRKYSFNIR